MFLSKLLTLIAGIHFLDIVIPTVLKVISVYPYEILIRVKLFSAFLTACCAEPGLETFIGLQTLLRLVLNCVHILLQSFCESTIFMQIMLLSHSYTH